MKSFQLPVVLENSSHSCCWPCSKGKIVYTLKVQFGAYAPGQIVNYSLQISNQSMDDTEGYVLEFSQKITFNARTPHHKERHTTKVLVSKRLTDTCLRLSNRMFEGDFLIPAIPPTTDKSSIICVEYYLKITVQLPCCKPNTDLKVPLVIGTIPIRESVTGNRLLNSMEVQPFIPSAPEISSPENETMDSSAPHNSFETSQ